MEIQEEKYDALLKELEMLRKENEDMKALLFAHGLAYEYEDKESRGKIRSLYSPISFPTVSLNEKQRVTLFHSLFRGREDVFALRWQNDKIGKGGYQPVCVNSNRWGVCNRKQYRCTECPNRNFRTLGYQDIYNHLMGSSSECNDVIGLYAIMSDNNCCFLCTDFDDKSCIHGYKDDVLAFVGVCKEWNIPYSIERSRSGNGAHVWIFFDRPLPAYKARRLGNAILTEAMNRDGRMSFASYDRFFPNQDYLPDGGFGNLVALPLQGKARKEKLNSVFVDDNFLAYKNQWAYLSQVKKISESTIDTILQQHVHNDLGALSTSSETKPWVTPTPQNISRSDFSVKTTITVADKIYIPLKSTSAKVLNHIKRIAAFKNPEFYKKQVARMSTYNIPRVISCFDIIDDYLAIPRGCMESVISFFDSYKAQYEIVDETNHGTPISATFKGQEYDEQLAAIEALTAHNNGILHATTAFGKTVTAASIVARKKVNTLILVHSETLLHQWHNQLTEFLDIDYIEPEQPKKRGRRKPFSPIGCLSSKQNSLHGIIDIALIQSCVRDGEVKPFVRDYGLVIADECHHTASYTFELVSKALTAHTVYGLTATPFRKDGHQPIALMQLGPIRYVADAKAQIAKQTFKRYLIPRFTTFKQISDERKDFMTLLKELTSDEVRNQMIAGDVIKAVASNRTPIVITRRLEHVEIMRNLITPHVQNVICLTGSGTSKEKQQNKERLLAVSHTEPLVIIGIDTYIGEGFDFPRLDTMFVALPISWHGTVEQCAGRLHREYDGKKDVRIYDYIDIHVPMLEAMYHKRSKGYANVGYQVITKEQPTLFDDLDDIYSQPAEGQIFNGCNYLRSFAKDIAKAKRSIVIASPKLYLSNKTSLVDALKELMARGVQVVVITRTDNEYKEQLSGKGITVKVAANLTLSCCIIDKSTVWYGDVNILGYATDKDNIIKVEDRKLADELLGMFG